MVGIKEEPSPMEVTSDNLMELGESSVVDIEALPSKIRSYLKMDQVEFSYTLQDYWKKETSTLPKLTESLYIDEENFLDTLLHIIVSLRKVWQKFYVKGMKGWQAKEWLPICLSSYLSLKVIAKEYLKEPNELFFSLFELWPYSERRFQELLPSSAKSPSKQTSILKGILIIHMLDDYFGEKVQEAILEIMREKYSVDSSEKLWKILSEDGFDVAEFVDSYKMLGTDLPVISTLQNNTDISFENDASSRYPKFPVTVCTMSDSGSRVEKIMIEGKTSLHSFKEGGAKWIKVNSSNAGLYALNYNGNLKNVCSLRISELEKLNSIDRASLLLNLDFSTIDGLELSMECFKFLKTEKDVLPLATACRKFLYINRFLYGTHSYEVFSDHIKSLFKVEGDIFDDRINKDDAKRTFHCMMFHIGCFVGSEECLKKAKDIFQSFIERDTSMPVEFRNCVFIYGARGSAVSGEIIRKKYLEEKDELKKKLLARALGSLKEADLKMCFTEIISKGKMPPDHVMIFFHTCAIVGSFLPAWKFLITSRESLIKQLKMDIFMLIIGEFVPSMYLDEHFAELDDLLNNISNYEGKRCLIETAKKKKAFVSEDKVTYEEEFEYVVAKRAKLDESATLDRAPELNVLVFNDTTLWSTLEFFEGCDIATLSRINAWEIIRTFVPLFFHKKLCILRPPCWGKTTTLHILKLFLSKVFNQETSEEKKDVIPIDVFKGRQRFVFGNRALAFFHSAEDETTRTDDETTGTDDETTRTDDETTRTENLNSYKESYLCCHLDLSVVTKNTVSEIKDEISHAVHVTLATYKSFLSDHKRFKKCVDGTCPETGDHLIILRDALTYLKNLKVFGSLRKLILIDEIDMPILKLRNAKHRETMEKDLQSFTRCIVSAGYQIICFGVFPDFCENALSDKLTEICKLDKGALKPVFGVNSVEVMNCKNEDGSLAECAGGFTYPGTKLFSLYCMYLLERKMFEFETVWVKSKSYAFVWETFGNSYHLCNLAMRLLDNEYVFTEKEGDSSDRCALDLFYHTGFVVKLYAEDLSLDMWLNAKNDYKNQRDPTKLVYYAFPNNIMKNTLLKFLRLRIAHDFFNSVDDFKVMIDEFVNGNKVEIKKRICGLYNPTKISCEKDYETQLRAILFVALRKLYYISRQSRSGTGIFDLALYPKGVKSPCYVIEEKFTDKVPSEADQHEKELNHLSAVALHQIRSKGYNADFDPEGENTISIGIAVSPYAISCSVIELKAIKTCQCKNPIPLCKAFLETKLDPHHVPI
ncbi:uncharacterized protein LOC135845302 isoform X2 [Planococcus citri]|uniref:uncharacterized protein LOC135845302 isoform X2 n=1 Tax=Planococcus citri TaxID=170843 RepID=UPI0031F8E706